MTTTASTSPSSARVAKALKTDHDLALQLWATDDTAARLVAILICRPKSFTAAELDRDAARGAGA